MAGDTLSFGEASLRVLWPGTDPPSQPPSRADRSLVVQVSAGGMNFLLPADTSREVEKEILALREPLESQVLEVAHHGPKSATSRAFLARVAPRVAVITSAAESGRADLPNREILKALEDAGARVFRTDTDGATTVEAKDGSLVVRTYTGSEAVVVSGGNIPPPHRR
jgi:competence protein ComEC